VATLQAAALHQGPLQLPGGVLSAGPVRYAVVVKEPAPALHLYVKPAGAAPAVSVPLGPEAAVTHAGNGTDKFGFVLRAPGAAAVTAFADAPAEQEKWIQALINAGALYQETDNAAVLSAKTIYEFAAKDILGADVSLGAFAGKVVLVVNVASA
jgi:hypothetical protein